MGHFFYKTLVYAWVYLQILSDAYIVSTKTKSNYLSQPFHVWFPNVFKPITKSVGMAAYFFNTKSFQNMGTCKFKGVLHPRPIFWLFEHFSQKLQHMADK